MRPPREQSRPKPNPNITRPLAQFAQYFQATTSDLTSLPACAEQLANCMKAILPLARIRVGTYEGSTGLVKWLFADHSLAASVDEQGVRPEDALREAIATREILLWKSADTGCCLIAPLMLGKRVVGVVEMQALDDALWFAEMREPISTLCGYFGLVIENFSLSTKSNEVEASVLEDERRKNQKLRSIIDVARSIAHELNQPLTGIGGYCTLIREDLSDDHAIIKDIDEIMKQAARLEELVYRFQNITHVEYDDNNRGKPQF